MASATFRRLKPESGELLHLDFLRLVAAYAIVLVHFRTNLLAGFENPQPIARALDSLGLCVDLFFLISGFVISWVYKDSAATGAGYGRFMWKRLARLVPLHWATLAFFAAVGLASVLFSIQLDRAAKYDWSCLPANALMLHAWYACDTSSFNTVSWSISAEMTMYLLFPAIFALVTRRTSAAVALLAVVTVCLYVIPAEPEWYDRTFKFGVVRAFPAFLLGVILYHRRDWLKQIWRPRLLLFGAGFMFLAGVALSVPKGWLVPLVYLTGTFAVAADMQGKVGRVVRTLAPGGQLTYSIYMLHPIVQSLMIALVGRKILGLTGWGLSMWTVLAFVVTGAVGYLSLLFFEEKARHRFGPKRREAVTGAHEQAPLVPQSL